MKIAIVGSGYVGLVTGTCLADVGCEVCCVDVDEQKIAKLKRAESPIYEPGLDELLKNNIEKKRLTFSIQRILKQKCNKRKSFNLRLFFLFRGLVQQQ